MIHILVVEDDSDLNSTICKYLQMKSFACSAVYDGEEAVSMVYENHYDIIILDGKLPRLNGFEVAAQIRQSSTIPIIFLTSLNSNKDIEKGFLSGGDDYLTKPFFLSELHLRITAILRRLYKNESLLKISPSLEFNTQQQILYRETKVVKLTAKETRLLNIFIQNTGKILAKEDIFGSIYDYSEEVSESSLRVYINSLRKVLGKEKIQTVKNLGYRYVE